MFIKARNCTDTTEVLEKDTGVPHLHAKFIHFATSGQEANSSVPGSGTSASVGESNARLGNTAVVSGAPSGSFRYMASPAGSTVSRPTVVLRNASQLHLRESASDVGSVVSGPGLQGSPLMHKARGEKRKGDDHQAAWRLLGDRFLAPYMIGRVS